MVENFEIWGQREQKEALTADAGSPCALDMFVRSEPMPAHSRRMAEICSARDYGWRLARVMRIGRQRWSERFK